MDVNNHQSFSQRLIYAMQNAGFSSNRSPFGISIAKLSELTQHSPQICTYYLRDKVLPRNETILKLTEELNVNPGWLLFGEAASHSSQSISLSTPLFCYLFEKGWEIRCLFKSSAIFADFMLMPSEKIESMMLNDMQSIKVIDLMCQTIQLLKKID